MTRSDILTDWARASELADRMIRLGIDPQRVDDWLQTATTFYRRCLDELDRVGAR